MVFIPPSETNTQILVHYTFPSHAMMIQVNYSCTYTPHNNSVHYICAAACPSARGSEPATQTRFPLASTTR